MGKVTIAIHSYKGGTGKTTMCANLGYLLAVRGYKVCLIDLDFRAPSLHALGVADQDFESLHVEGAHAGEAEGLAAIE